ncbi:hypothetical protein KU855_01465 [Shewanella sp. NIFS-20-20]|nr:hypothetical protein [Shewanella sp. NIFS-20-20]
MALDSHAEDDWQLNFGGFYARSDTDLQVTSPLTNNPFTLDLESDLKLAKNQFLPFIELEYHFNERHQLFIEWERLHRSATNEAITTPFELSLNDNIYTVQAGVKLETELNIDILRLGYSYSILQSDHYDLGVSVGLHTMMIKTGLQGQIGACLNRTTGGQCNIQTIPRYLDENITAPLPDVGVYGDYEFYPGWTFKAHAQYFYIKFDDLQGSLYDVLLAVSSDINEDWQINLGYNYYKVSADIGQNLGKTDIKIADYAIHYQFIGPMISVSYKF